MLAARDPCAGEHARAVGAWVGRLCDELAIAGEARAFAELCGLLHDVGMIATPEAILRKAGPLNGVERSIVREHPAAGERILEGIAELSRCATVVRAHHERWDGTGYPDGLAYAAIPLEARIVAVADAFHAMISARPYRAPIAPRAALDVMAEGRGTQFDPAVVDALQHLYRHTQPAPRRADRESSSA